MKFLAIIIVLRDKEYIPKMFSRFLVKKPLVLYICETARNSKKITDFYIFCEDDNIAHIAEINQIKCISRSGLSERFSENPNKLFLDICKEIEDFEKKKYDYIAILQPGCPLINSETIDKSIEALIATKSDNALSVKIRGELGKSYWKKDSTGFGMKIPGKEEEFEDLTKKYKEINGILISKRKSLIKNINGISGKVKLIELSFPENLEINNHFDWWIGEKFLQRRRILIRADGYNEIGLGHIYRTLTIANKLIDHKILFVTKKEYHLGISLILEYNYELETFTSPKEFEDILDNFKPHIVINDILDTDLEYIEFLKEKNLFIVNFEDLGEGALKADIVINALYKRKHFLENHYWGKDYYILREEFFLVRQKKVEKEVKKIIITYGGTDPNNYTERVLNVINEIKMKDVEVVVILGLGYKNLEQLKENIKKMDLNVTAKQHINHISKYMYESDIAFTAAGRSVYELASIGTPTIVLVENKRGMLHTFADEKNGIIKLGLGYKIPNEDIKDALVKLINDYKLRENCNRLMLKNNLRSGVNNVISLIFSQYEKFEREEER